MTSPAPLEPENSIAARYGRTASQTRKTRVIALVAGIAFAVVFGAWLWWAGILAPAAQFEAKDTAHTIESDSLVSVTWQFTVDPGLAASCAVQALNSTYAIVGWRVVDVPPSDETVREFTEQVRTSEQAVTGLIYRCWLT